jgi:cytochrome c553
MNKLIALFAIAALPLTSASVLAAGNAEAGKNKAAACVACHGADGNSLVPAFPTIAGQHASYIVKQLAEFKDGTRANPTMAPMAAPLSEEDMADLGAYFAEQPRKGEPEDPAAGEIGKLIYEGGNLESGVPACMACHGPNGSGNPAAKFPALAGQKAAYNEAQLKAFRAGERANDMNKMMREAARMLTDAEIKAVSAYMQGMK